MNDTGVGESGKMRAELPTRRSSAEANPYDQILQHLQPVAPAPSTDRVSARGGADEGRAARPRVYLLGSVRRDDVLPAGRGRFVARAIRYDDSPQASVHLSLALKKETRAFEALLLRANLRALAHNIAGVNSGNAVPRYVRRIITPGSSAPNR